MLSLLNAGIRYLYPAVQLFLQDTLYVTTFQGLITPTLQRSRAANLIPIYHIRIIAISTPRYSKIQVYVAIAEKLEQILEILL